MASAMEPNTGTRPMRSPSVRFPLVSQAMPKASTGPDRVARPKLISPMTPVEPISTTKKKYQSRNVPPPYFETLVGNIQIFPIPTAEPMHARIKPHRVPNKSLFFSITPPQKGFFYFFI